MNTSETTRDAWDKIAKGYDRTNTPTQMWVGNEGLRRAGLRAGMKFLDVAAGSGATAFPRRVWVRKCWRRTSRRPCLNASRRA